MKKIVVILPTYNERGNISLLIEKIEAEFEKLDDYQSYILVVDDNSPDGTAEEVLKLSKKYKNIMLITGKKQGLGAAYVRGMRYAVGKMQADIFFEMDADLSHDPALIPLFVSELEKGADFVIGSRYIKGGSIPAHWGIDRKFFSIVGNLIARFGLMLLRVRDWTSGYRVMTKEVFSHIQDRLEKYTGYTFQIALLHRAIQKGFNISEIPLNFIDRKYGQSKFVPSEYIINSLLYILLNSSFIKFLIVGSFGFVIQTIIAKTLITIDGHPGLSVAIGAEAAIISNFTFNQFWTFSHKRIIGRRNIFKKFLGFNATALSAVIIQAVAVTIGTHFFGRDSWFIFMVASIVLLIIPYSYTMYHKVIWKEKKFVPSAS